jgi:alpha-methylacyl-CoA racemase
LGPTNVLVHKFAGLAPGPFAGLILADNGASVIRIDRPSAPSSDILCRGKKSAAINPKIPSGKAALLQLVASADILIEPFRPGVMERLGLGPEVFLGNDSSPGLNEKLIYARMIGCVVELLCVRSLKRAVQFPKDRYSTRENDGSELTRSTGPHKDMAGASHSHRYLIFQLSLGHDINYLALSGVLSVGILLDECCNAYPTRERYFLVLQKNRVSR